MTSINLSESMKSSTSPPTGELITPAKLEEIKYNDYIIRKFSHEDGFEAYYLGDIGNILKIKKPRSTISNFSIEDVVSDFDREKYQIITYQKYRNTYRKNIIVLLLTKRGLTNLLTKNRSPSACDLARFFNINVYEHRFAPVETTTIKLIQDTFAGENMITQYQVNNYKIDLYFPTHKIAIECDERNHNDRNPEYENNRENEIINSLNCTFIRYNPNAAGFSIGNILNQIYRKII